MGTICILIGVIILIAFSAVGVFVSNAVVSNQLYMSLLSLKNPGMVYGIVVSACALIGLLICLGLAMSGLIYNRVCKNGEYLSDLKRKANRASKKGEALEELEMKAARQNKNK